MHTPWSLPGEAVISGGDWNLRVTLLRLAQWHTEPGEPASQSLSVAGYSTHLDTLQLVVWAAVAELDGDRDVVQPDARATGTCGAAGVEAPQAGCWSIAGAVLLPITMVPSGLSTGPAMPRQCPRCDGDKTYAARADAPPCTCFPPVTPAMKWHRVLQELGGELQIASP